MSSVFLTWQPCSWAKRKKWHGVISAEYDGCGSTTLLCFSSSCWTRMGQHASMYGNSLPTCLAASGQLFLTDNIVLGHIPNYDSPHENEFIVCDTVAIKRLLKHHPSFRLVLSTVCLQWGCWCFQTSCMVCGSYRKHHVSSLVIQCFCEWAENHIQYNFSHH
jgi:hypothetical protein